MTKALLKQSLVSGIRRGWFIRHESEKYACFYLIGPADETELSSLPYDAVAHLLNRAEY